MTLGVGDSWYLANGYAGKTHTWVPSDTEENYNKNISDPKRRERLAEAGWTRDNVSYTFNTHGFRSEEFFQSGDSAMFLGCSLTTGIGVGLEYTWTHIVAQELGVHNYNLGVGGGCIDMCFRFAHYWIPQLRPKYVFMLTPNLHRLEIVTRRDNFLFLPNMTNDDSFYMKWLTNDVNGQMNRLKNQIAIRDVCARYDAELFEIQVEDTMEKRRLLGANTWARDIMHPGKEWNRALADDFLSMMA